MARLAWIFLAALALAPRPARADAPRAPQATFDDAERDDAAGAYARALAEYEDALQRAPSAAFVPRAAARARALRTHAEGDFAPLARLEQIRRDPRMSSDPAALAALAKDADAFPPGPVRGEARMLVAEAYLGRLARPGDALPLLDAIAGDPSADPLTARLALRMLVDARLAAGDLRGATHAVRAHPAVADPSVTKQLAQLARLRVAHDVALGVLGALAALAGASVARAARRGELARVGAALRRAWPIAAAFAAYVAGVGGLLAAGYEAGTSAPFVAFGAAVLPIALVARAWGAAGSTRPWARAARAVVCGGAAVGAGLLVLEWIDARYLRSFGL